MKPIPQINHNQRGSRHKNRAKRSNPRVLPTDYNYHSTSEIEVNSSAARPTTKLPAFHKLSSEFLGAERSRDYIAELSFFILITGIAAWPVVSMLIAITRLVRNY
ncbi:MAG TPA: hypothetical protein VGM65_05690 [Candidatus Udaeobacter sp.]|jgi:hypothetical protein